VTLIPNAAASILIYKESILQLHIPILHKRKRSPLLPNSNKFPRKSKNTSTSSKSANTINISKTTQTIVRTSPNIKQLSRRNHYQIFEHTSKK
jgi:hypothetical protein